MWRRGAAGLEIVVVHRPRHDDWSLPKGKAEPGESDEDCACREVAEETGLDCRLGAELPTSRYRDRHGRPKVVRYWAMEPVAGRLRPAPGEVDDVRWLPVAEALDLLTYDQDWQVVAALASRVEIP